MIALISLFISLLGIILCLSSHVPYTDLFIRKGISRGKGWYIQAEEEVQMVLVVFVHTGQIQMAFLLSQTSHYI